MKDFYFDSFAAVFMAMLMIIYDFMFDTHTFPIVVFLAMIFIQLSRVKSMVETYTLAEMEYKVESTGRYIDLIRNVLGKKKKKKKKRRRRR